MGVGAAALAEALKKDDSGRDQAGSVAGPEACFSELLSRSCQSSSETVSAAFNWEARRWERTHGLGRICENAWEGVEWVVSRF